MRAAGRASPRLATLAPRPRVGSKGPLARRLHPPSSGPPDHAGRPLSPGRPRAFESGRAGASQFESPPNLPTFSALGLASGLLSAVRAEGYDTPPPIQAKAIPPVLAGRDLL